MTYSEHGLMKADPASYRVTVRVGGVEYVRDVSGALSPMGTVQAMIAAELGLELWQVSPVTYRKVEGGTP